MINEYENLLRDIIIKQLGFDPITYKTTPERIKIWNEKKDIVSKRKIGLPEDRIIYYSDFYDLKTIITKNWETFLPIFLDKKRFEIFFDEVEKYRNSIAHGRPLLKSQLLLLEGILKDQKNLRTIYHNKNEMKEDYFIRIERITDNLGNIWTEKINNNKKVLRVGDYYELLIEAVDPKDREIEYQLYFSLGKLDITQKENQFSFEISENMIGDIQDMTVIAKTPNSSYINETRFIILQTILPQ